MDTQKHKVTNVRLPMCGHGFRSGWARAIVDGMPCRIYTSQSDQTDYNEHMAAVSAQFENGQGEYEHTN